MGGGAASHAEILCDRLDFVVNGCDCIYVPRLPETILDSPNIFLSGRSMVLSFSSWLVCRLVLSVLPERYVGIGGGRF